MKTSSNPTQAEMLEDIKVIFDWEFNNNPTLSQSRYGAINNKCCSPFIPLCDTIGIGILNGAEGLINRGKYIKVELLYKKSYLKTVKNIHTTLFPQLNWA